MSKSNTFENDLLLLLFDNTAIADIGDVAGLRATTTAGTFWVSLYTADPGEGGTAVTNETAYTPYVRVAIARSGTGFVVTGIGDRQTTAQYVEDITSPRRRLVPSRWYKTARRPSAPIVRDEIVVEDGKAVRSRWQ